MDKLVVMLRAAGDPTRLRLLLLLRQAELTVSELVEIVGQSQPRVSRHLKLLCEASLIARFKEGSWVLYRATDEGLGTALGAALSELAAGPVQTDLKRLTAVREARAAEAAAYFKANASQWGRIRALHAPEMDVEGAILRHLDGKPIENLLDAGTGTGRMLELLASHAKRAVGIDVSPEMLAIARDRLMRANLAHCQVRLGDTYRLPYPAGGALTGFDTVLFHQVSALSRRSGRGGRRSRAGDARGRAAFDRRFRLARSGVSASGLCPSPSGLFRPRGSGLVRGRRSEAARWGRHRAPCRFQGKADGKTVAGPGQCKIARGGGMSLKDIALDARPIGVSFEFFPPKTAQMEEQLWRAVKRLEPLAPDFVSVTYGAGGSTRDRTHATVKRIVEETKLSPAAHLTCVAAARSEVDDVVRGYWDAGVRHIVALRGDMPEAGTSYAAHPQGYASTPELIAGIMEIAPFAVSVSCYPERHPDSPSLDHDIALLKRKVDAGAARAIGQFCFDNDAVARLRDRAAAASVTAPIVPGLMPSTNFVGIARMAARCGASIPPWLARLYEGLEDDLESRRIIAANVLAEQVQELHAHGFDKFHFYTLNQADLTYATCRMLGLAPKELS